MFREIKARRAARRLVDAFPGITEGTARDRARRLLGQYPALTASDAADSLIRGERTARYVERVRGTWA